MDPEACWQDLVQAMRDADYDLIYVLSASLYHWISNGGFMPKPLVEMEYTKRSALHMLLTLKSLALNAAFDEEHE